MSSKHENSRKRQLLRAFDAVVPRLQRGEQVFIPLEGRNPAAEWASMKTYWYTWRKLQQVLNPEAYWLGAIEARLQNLGGQYAMLLTPPVPGGVLTARYTAAAQAEVHKLGTYVSPVDGTIAPIQQSQATPEEIAALEAKGALITKWASWMESKSRTDLDPTRDPSLFDWYKEPWDSERAVEFRAKFGG